MVKIRVPATTANIGPGFDALGCALSLYNDFTFEKTESGLTITGCPAEYANAENLCYQAYAAACARLGVPADGVRIDIETNVPLARGLGSSATCLVAGVMGANALHGWRLTEEKMLEEAARIEGHPDNVAPALYGGLTASFLRDGTPVTALYRVHPDVRFFAMIPDFELSTHEARAALPKTIAYADAVFNISRTAVLLRALETGDRGMISSALEDRLHQPYRRPLIRDYDRVMAAAKAAGAYATFISGAGPTLMALAGPEFAPERIELPEGWCVLPLTVDAMGARVL